MKLVRRTQLEVVTARLNVAVETLNHIATLPRSEVGLAKRLAVAALAFVEPAPLKRGAV